MQAISVLWIRAAASSWLCWSYASSPLDSLSSLISVSKALSKAEFPLGLQLGNSVAVGGAVAVNVDVGGGSPEVVIEGVSVGPGVDVAVGVADAVGV